MSGGAGNIGDECGGGGIEDGGATLRISGGGRH